MSTKAEIAVSYSIDNEFFRLWLDREMSYSGAVFDGTDSLEQAQRNKLEIIASYAGVAPGQTVLDIGCGWGANLAHLVSVRKVAKAHGITLSEAQLAEVKRRELPSTSAWCTSYTDFEPSCLYDAITSIGMFEHVATPADARAGKQVELYRDFFRRAHAWTRPGAKLALQTIVRNLVPRNRQDLRDTVWMMDTIFPGSMPPRLEDVSQAISPYWEVLELKTRRQDYARTCAEWRLRLYRNEARIREQWGDRLFDDYIRCMSICVRGFSHHFYSLTQWSLGRIDKGPELPPEPREGIAT